VASPLDRRSLKVLDRGDPGGRRQMAPLLYRRHRTVKRGDERRSTVVPRAEVCSLPPVGRGLGVGVAGLGKVLTCTTPFLFPPPQGGREHTRVAPRDQICRTSLTALCMLPVAGEKDR
jgi:hypothetical protein